MRDNQVVNQEHLSEDLLNMYLDGELSAGERGRVEAHMSVCNACQSEFSALQQLYVALDELDPAMAPNLVPSVLSRVGSPPTLPQVPASRFRALPWLTAALQAIAALALLAWGWQQLADLWSTVNDSLLPAAARVVWSKVSVWAVAQWSAVSAWPSTAWAEVQTWLARLSASVDLPLPLNQVTILGVALIFVWLLGNAVLLRRALLNGHFHSQRRY